MLTVSGVRFNFDDNESLKISDKRKMVSLSRTFRFRFKIQENRTTQFKVKQSMKQKTAFDIPISFFLARFFCARFFNAIFARISILYACAPWTRDEEISSTLKIIQTSVNLQKKFNTTHILRKIRNFAIFLQTFENNCEMTNLSQRGKIFTT